jgi:hypothetical protein
LTRRIEGDAVTSLTSDTAIAFCLSVFRRLEVDWKLHGFDTTALHELAEMTLRTVQSLLTDPGQRVRDEIALRRFVARWLGPVILYPRMTSLSIHERRASSDWHIEAERRTSLSQTGPKEIEATRTRHQRR